MPDSIPIIEQQGLLSIRGAVAWRSALAAPFQRLASFSDSNLFYGDAWCSSMEFVSFCGARVLVHPSKVLSRHHNELFGSIPENSGQAASSLLWIKTHSDLWLCASKTTDVPSRLAILRPPQCDFLDG